MYALFHHKSDGFTYGFNVLIGIFTDEVEAIKAEEEYKSKIDIYKHKDVFLQEIIPNKIYENGL